MFRNAPVMLVLLAVLSFGACEASSDLRTSQEPTAIPDTSDMPTNMAPPRSPDPKTREGLSWMHLRDDYYLEDHWRWSFPSWAYERIESSDTEAKYDLSDRVNPFLLNGDFDGDGKYDVAVILQNRKDSEELDVMVVHRNGGLHFLRSWSLVWELYPKGKVYQGVGEGPPPKLIGDALLFVKPEAASALYYWDGKEYKRYQQGD